MGILDIQSGAVCTLISGGKWDAGEVSTCDFGITELSASSVILQPGPNSTQVPITFGTMGQSSGARQKIKVWDIAGIAFVKDMGNARDLLGRMWTVIDDLDTTINADDTLSGTACAAYLSDIGRPSADTFYEYQGTLYGFVTFSILAQDVE